MTEITQLGYLEFRVSDLGTWQTFATDLLGLVVARKLDDGFSLQLDAYAQRFFVREGEIDDLAVVGLQTESAADMEAVAQRVRDAGVDVTVGDDAAKALRQVDGLVRFAIPDGIDFEVYHGPKMASEPFQSPLNHDGFKAGELGLGHFVMRAKNLEKTLSFVTEVLGFRLSDRIVCDIGGYHVNIAFTHCNPRHHSLALGENLPKNIHHFMLECNNIDDVGKCWDRVVNAGMTVWNAIGRHPNDRMISFYAETPSGFQFEYGWGGLEIEDDEAWETYVYDHISEWGHEHPGQMFKKLFKKKLETQA